VPQRSSPIRYPVSDPASESLLEFVSEKTLPIAHEQALERSASSGPDALLEFAGEATPRFTLLLTTAWAWLRRLRALPLPVSSTPFLLGAVVGGALVFAIEPPSGPVPVERTRLAATGLARPTVQIIELVQPGIGKPKPSRPYGGNIRIDSEPPDARVFLNAQLVGNTPLLLSNIPVGSRAIRLEKDGFERWSSVVQIVNGRQGLVNATLRRASR
jgi:hypothetical protein